AAEALTVACDPGTRNTPQSQSYTADQSCKAEPTDGGGKPVGILVTRTLQRLAVRALQCEFEDVIAERAKSMVILAMHVVRYCSTHCNERRARSDWWKP